MQQLCDNSVTFLDVFLLVGKRLFHDLCSDLLLIPNLSSLMKIKFISLMYVAMLGLLLASCSDSNDKSDSEGGGGGGGYDGPDKEFLEQTGTELVGSFNSSDFNNFYAIRRVLENEYAYEGSEAEQHLDAVYNVRQALNEAGSVKYYKRTLALANFSGNYYLSNGTWHYQSGNGLKCTFNDANGQQVVATVSSSGTTKTVYLFDETKRHYEYIYPSYTSWREETQVLVTIPQRVVVTVTQGGKTILESTTTVDLSNVTEGAKFDLSRNNLNVTTKTVINGLYTINVSQAKYTANGESKAEFTISNASKTLISGSATGSSQLTNDKDEVEVKSLRNLNATLDILGRVQLKASCNDGIALSDCMDEAHANRYEEQAYKQTLNRTNTLYSANMYYNNNSTVKGTLTLEPFGDTYRYYAGWNGNAPIYETRTRWESKPIITFTSDNSSYALEDYFTETRFKTVIDNFKSLVESVARNFTDERIDW